MINKVIFIGNLGRDPEVHTASSGNIVTQLSLATSRRVKNADGTFKVGDRVRSKEYGEGEITEIKELSKDRRVLTVSFRGRTAKFIEAFAALEKI